MLFSNKSENLILLKNIYTYIVQIRITLLREW